MQREREQWRAYADSPFGMVCVASGFTKQGVLDILKVYRRGRYYQKAYLVHVTPKCR